MRASCTHAKAFAAASVRRSTSVPISKPKLEFVDFFFYETLQKKKEKKVVRMEVQDGASAGRGEGGADAPAAHARPSEHTAAPARPASASAITAIVLALGDAARAEQQRGDQAPGGVPGGGSTDDAAGAGSEGQQGSGTHLAGQVAVCGF